MRVGPGSRGAFEVVEAPAVTKLIGQAIAADPRIADLWDGLIWLIARSGHKIGEPITFQGKAHRIYKTLPTRSGLPSLRIVYFHDIGRFTIKILSISYS
ncbi:hypothetical protein RB623_16505 [Mesorhizobium sp. LHD-90]|uniref:hypothetical protein n=1 Tax=Mesorhizobium sp. LHD-90 TaxID=3071414 RepID=UPI0027E1F602|nr:hypothetical protein [Mesorhizobium sp. LHD-90]MDQ6435661.1 hypothetical protein [Mesorhizobium sp. LHD-90]